MTTLKEAPGAPPFIVYPGEPSLTVRIMEAGLMPLLAFVPIPHAALRWYLERDNAAENERGWERLRDVNELGRYQVVQGYIETFAPGGAVLDLGCAQGILHEGLRYGAYTGLDPLAETIETARAREDDRTRFVVGDAATYVPDREYDAIVFNECLYYFDDPVATIRRYRSFLAPDGVFVISLFNRLWFSRRLLRRLPAVGRLAAQTRVYSRQGAGWTIGVYVPGQD